MCCQPFNCQSACSRVHGQVFFIFIYFFLFILFYFRSLLFRQEKELKFFVVWKAERRNWPVSRDTFLRFESVGTGGNLSRYAPRNRSCTSLCTVASVMFIRIVKDWIWFVICLQCCFFVHALSRCNVSVGCKNAFRISVNFITVNWCIFYSALLVSWKVDSWQWSLKAN